MHHSAAFVYRFLSLRNSLISFAKEILNKTSLLTCLHKKKTNIITLKAEFLYFWWRGIGGTSLFFAEGSGVREAVRTCIATRYEQMGRVLQFDMSNNNPALLPKVGLYRRITAFGKQSAIEPLYQHVFTQMQAYSQVNPFNLFSSVGYITESGLDVPMPMMCVKPCCLNA